MAQGLGVLKDRSTIGNTDSDVKTVNDGAVTTPTNIDYRRCHLRSTIIANNYTPSAQSYYRRLHCDKKFAVSSTHLL